jgi:DNA mismatch repair ATPase MutS
MHKEIKQVKSGLVPVIQMIALLDAYCSIAQLYKEHKNKENQFSFVTFVDASEPFVAYNDVWLALLSHDKAVANDVYLGNCVSGKIIITGPNGGGKSTFLKTGGIAAVLAQSWCIVPAAHARQTVFHGIKTGLAPHEDLQQGLSTFMAEKKCMEYLDGCIKRTHKAHSMLVLIDEPYKGTVDDESAKRIYSFGMNIAFNPYALVCIATHVKKPILLEKDTNGAFANYHVEIKEESHGIFKRLFKLKQGPAMWWFEDEGQRERFVDWISSLLSSEFKIQQQGRYN